MTTETDHAHPLALEQNLALMAGAGTGKTYSLVTLALHLLGGAREGRDALRPNALCMLTFTDKAAGEMRARLRARLDSLASGTTRADEEVELRASFERLAKPLPPPDFWRGVRDALGSAAIGTFHSLCGQLLRRAPAGFGVDPSFVLLDEHGSRTLLEELAERVVIEALEEGVEEVELLCRDRGVLGQGRMRGLADDLVSAYQKVREEGVAIDTLEVTDAKAARREFEEAFAAWKGLFRAAFAKAEKDRQEYIEPLRRCAAAVEGLTFENFAAPERAPAIAAAFASQPNWSRQAEPLKRVRLDWSQKDRIGVSDLHATARFAPLEERFRWLLSSLSRRHREALAKRNALDFAEMVLRARDLLRDWPQARGEVQGRIGALLVDEFQDTNRVQLEVVMLLAEQREGAPRAMDPPTPLELPLERGFLCAVGDRKQSIYEFRGADVSVFSMLSDRIVAQGGRRWFLRQNRRSAPALLGFFNRAFTELMQPEGRPAEAFDVVYVPEEDDFLSFRAESNCGRAVLRLRDDPAESSALGREAEATALARWLGHTLASGSTVRVSDRDTGELRPARGGDVAILFRAFTQVEVYRQALLREGVAHRIVRGRGFYAAQEVLDLASFLSIVADPSDSLAWAAVLRSPLVGLTDTSLVRLALAGDRSGKFTLTRELMANLDIPPPERERLSHFVELHEALRKQRDRLGVRLLLKVVLEETGYRSAMAGTAYGEQILANLDKLLDLASRWDASSRGDAAELSRELFTLAEAEPSEAQGDTLDAHDSRAVQLMTIHQSKGLEWPIVIVPDLGSRPRAQQERVLLSRREGLALRPSGGGWVPRKICAPRFERIREELACREAAQRQRLLYVALTRARDRLVLSGERQKNAGRSWADQLDAVLADPTLAPVVEEVHAATLPPREDSEQAAPPADSREQLEAALARVRGGSPAPARTAIFPVTQLQDFSRCPRRYRYLHQVGLTEHPAVLAIERDEEEFGEDRRERGTAAHKLLETVDLSLVAEGGAALKRALGEGARALGFAPEKEAGREVVSWAQAFLTTPFLREALKGGARVRREWPFLLRLAAPPAEDGAGGPELFLKGQIDLLLEHPDGTVTVIDYKSSVRHPAGLAPYGFQLGCYALAAGRLAGPGHTVRTGVAYLREKNVGPDLIEPRRDGAFEAGLWTEGRDLLLATRTGHWEGRPVEHCAALRCGFQLRCHPGLLSL